ncbi:MAG: serine hydrolase [Propionibacteriaceae bacterium]
MSHRTVSSPAALTSAAALTRSLPREAGWSIVLLDVDTDTVVWELDGVRVLDTASIAKVFLLIEAARMIEAGELDPAEQLDRSAGPPVADSGLWYLLDADTFSVQDTCILVGAFSDNLATNVLLARIGLDRVQAATREYGWTDSVLLDYVRDSRTPDQPRTLSRGSAAELADVMARLHRGEVVSAAVSAQVLEWLAVDADLSMVAAAFGLDPLAHREQDRGLTLRNKTGTIETARGDIGVVSGSGGRSLAYAVLANWDSDGPDPRDEVLAGMQAVGTWIRGWVA